MIGDENNSIFLRSRLASSDTRTWVNRPSWTLWGRRRCARQHPSLERPRYWNNYWFVQMKIICRCGSTWCWWSASTSSIVPESSTPGYGRLLIDDRVILVQGDTETQTILKGVVRVENVTDPENHVQGKHCRQWWARMRDYDFYPVFGAHNPRIVESNQRGIIGLLLILHPILLIPPSLVIIYVCCYQWLENMNTHCQVSLIVAVPSISLVRISWTSGRMEMISWHRSPIEPEDYSRWDIVTEHIQ